MLRLLCFWAQPLTYCRPISIVGDALWKGGGLRHCCQERQWVCLHRCRDGRTTLQDGQEALLQRVNISQIDARLNSPKQSRANLHTGKSLSIAESCRHL